MKNKILSFILSVFLILPCMVALTACGKDSKPENKTSKLMIVSLNPSVEFVLNEKDVVVSVNAVNDDGNFIIDSATLTGLSADDAVDLFLQIAKENGLVLENTTEDLKIEISGKNAKELYKRVSKSAKDFLKSSNIELNVSFEKISKDEIELMVRECMREFSIEELDKLSEEKLLSLLKKSRNETSDLFSQELKELYYQIRAQQMIDAKCEKVEALISTLMLPEEYDEIISNFETAYQDYTLALETFKTEYEAIYMDAESEYQIAMQEYIDAKRALLKARVEGLEDLTSYEQALIDAEDALYGNVEKEIVGAQETAQTVLFEYKFAMDNAMTEIESAVDTIFTSLFSFIDMSAIETHINDAKEGFKNHFNDEFSSHIENRYWSELTPNK